ncbi:MAG: tail fiber domain-containing protein [Burkholderiales bacterium]
MGFERTCLHWAMALSSFGVALTAGAAQVGTGERDSAEIVVSAVPSPLLAIDRNRATVVDRVVAQWGDELARSSSGITQAQLREMLLAMRADQLLAASLAGSLDGLRNVVSASLLPEAEVKPSLLHAKALGDANQDVTYVPVTPCRLVETRGTFAAVYQGGGAFAPNEIRTYTLQGGNGVCLSQLPGSVSPSAVQMQVYGIPITTGSGDIEILPQGGTFGSTATLVYLGNNAFTSASSTSLANLANKQISVQVRGGGAHVAIDVVGYFRAPQGGFVTHVATGPGLTGGTITSTGVIGLATTQLLPITSCANGQITRWISGAWSCSNDSDSGGTVTSVATGTGLSGGPITISGTLSLAPGYQLPQSCTNGQVAKSNGSGGWACASDAVGSGTVTSVTAGAGLTGGTITTSGTIAVDPASATLTGNFFKQGGNAFGATAVLGTNDNNSVEIRGNGARMMRYEPNAISPNVLGGSPANVRYPNVRGATIAGGGVPVGNLDPDFGTYGPNEVRAHYVAIGGGLGNVAGNGLLDAANGAFATVSGGRDNTASGLYSSVGGGRFNQASGSTSTVAAGNFNSATATSSTVSGGDGNGADGTYSAIGGGASNHANSSYSTVGGGSFNATTGTWSTVSGGVENIATGDGSMVPGGRHNNASGAYSWAGGYNANTETLNGLVSHDGAFAWSDFNDFKFNTSANNEFAVRATGGVRFVTAINGSGSATQSLRIFPGGDVTSTGDIFAVAFHATSDRDAKTAFAPVDADAVLDAVLHLPIESWTYRSDARGARHIGPTAQDFRAAFALGHDDKSIATVDADGVALAAIQGLNARLEAKVAEQAREIAEIKSANAIEIAELKRAVEVLLARTSPEGRVAAR